MRIEDNILNHMMETGIVKHEGGQRMAHMDTLDGKYRLQFERKNTGFFAEGETSYKCIFTVIDKVMNTEICRMEGTENDIYIQLDQLSAFYIFRMDLTCSSWPSNSKGRCDYFELEGPKVIIQNGTELISDIDILTIKIMEYNSITGQVIERVGISLYSEEFEKMMDMMYFIYLIDTDYFPNIERRM